MCISLDASCGATRQNPRGQPRRRAICQDSDVARGSHPLPLLAMDTGLVSYFPCLLQKEPTLRYTSPCVHHATACHTRDAQNKRMHVTDLSFPLPCRTSECEGAPAVCMGVLQSLGAGWASLSDRSVTRTLVPVAHWCMHAQVCLLVLVACLFW